MQLTAPDTHLILVEAHGESYAPPIVGSVTITVPTESIQSLNDYTVTIGLRRTIGLQKQQPAPPSDRDDLLFPKMLRRRSLRKPSYRSCEPAVCASVDTFMECNLWHAPEKIEHNRDHGTTSLNFPFAVPLPHHLPATTETILGSISYAIKATASSASAKSIDTIRPIQIQRRLVPQRAESVCHMRSFSDEELMIELRITPQEPSSSNIKSAYSVELAAYRTVTQAARKTEIKLAVIKELKWRVEETIKGPCPLISEENEDVAIRRQGQHTRQLCEGKRKGNWKAMGYSRGTPEEEDKIEIPFGITIPRSADATDALENCAETSGLTVNHRLRLDIVTGEDTLDQATGRLVDRRPRKKSFVSFYALPVLEFASKKDLTRPSFLPNTLPKYEDSAEPPSYEALE